MAKIVGVRRNEDGAMSEFKLDDGREMRFGDCYDAINRGEIEDVVATRGKGDVRIIRSVNDGVERNNLSNLPSF